MYKYIQDQFIRSRLKIVYRTHVEGTPVAEELPFRLLVLGDFSGLPVEARPPLRERRVLSISKGVKFSDVLADLNVAWKITPDTVKKSPELGQLINGVEGDFRADIAVDAGDVNDGKIKASVTVTLEGLKLDDNIDKCNGLGDFFGRFPDVQIEFPIQTIGNYIKIGGVTLNEQTDVEVKPLGPIKLEGTIGADPSWDSSEVASRDVLTGYVNGNFASTFTGKVASEGERKVIRGRIEGKAWATLALPIRNLDSFSPDKIGQYIPEIRRLRLVEDLVHELQATVLSNPALKRAVRDLLLNPADKEAQNARDDKLKKLRDELRSFAPYAQIEPPPSTIPDQAKPPIPPQAKTLAETAYPGTVPKGTALFQLTAPAATATGTSAATAVQVPHAGLSLYDRVPTVLDQDRFINCLAALFTNLSDADLAGMNSIVELSNRVTTIASKVEGRINTYLTRVLQDPTLQTIERSWRGLAELCDEVVDDKVIIDVLDVTKEELGEDLTDNNVDLLRSPFFKKLYQDEYDRYGGRPFGVMIGLYDFDITQPDDLAWIQTMSRVANLAHCPFIAAASPASFRCKSAEELDALDDIDARLSQPQYGKWDAFRQTDGAAYIGLTLPRYLLRLPWSEDDSAHGNRVFKYDELRQYDDIKGALEDKDLQRKGVLQSSYLWGNAAILFARNLVRSFQFTGWCQRIRGQNGGGMIQGLNVHEVDRGGGRTELQPPLEIALPDYKELQLANKGFIPLVWRKGTADATFFSARSAKKALQFKEDRATQNADLICNLAYTLSITRIAHYIKLMVRPYIGTSADGKYVQSLIDAWLKSYVTTVVNPDDLTLQQYPFKAASVDVTTRPGPLGWYSAKVAITPHLQFEGMDVELSLEAALGGAK
ncbi:type VI secretion system contractile sheath large subunit [Sorangium sp. So ce321]|uniref:type VI secretion system contractile sheath large subunit n=1 Tax=Sorangium sp. So ce321 TaxID=3133300 RepID=UPI003F641C0C